MLRKWLFNLIATYIYHTPPHPGRGILGKLAYRIYPHEFLVEISPGVKMKLRLKYPSEIEIWSYMRGLTHYSAQVFVNHLIEGMTVFDIDANVGYYTLLIAQKVGSIGKVYAFEPIPETFARLQENIALNGFTNIVTIPAAVTDKDGIVRMSVEDLTSSLFRASLTNSIEVPAISLDSFVRQHRIEGVDAIKMDVEGAELLVLRGADQVIRRYKPIIMTEINPALLKSAGTTAEELFKAIIDYGYDSYVIRKGQPIPVTSVVKPSKRGILSSHLDDYLFLPR